jgi:hypothetical protein
MQRSRRRSLWTPIATITATETDNRAVVDPQVRPVALDRTGQESFHSLQSWLLENPAHANGLDIECERLRSFGCAFQPDGHALEKTIRVASRWAVPVKPSASRCIAAQQQIRSSRAANRHPGSSPADVHHSGSSPADVHHFVGRVRVRLVLRSPNRRASVDDRRVAARPLPAIRACALVVAALSLVALPGDVTLGLGSIP